VVPPGCFVLVLGRRPQDLGHPERERRFRLSSGHLCLSTCPCPSSRRPFPSGDSAFRELQRFAEVSPLNLFDFSWERYSRSSRNLIRSERKPRFSHRRSALPRFKLTSRQKPRKSPRTILFELEECVLKASIFLCSSQCCCGQLVNGHR
jgi:hypothetical protein